MGKVSKPLGVKQRMWAAHREAVRLPPAEVEQLEDELAPVWREERGFPWPVRIAVALLLVWCVAAVAGAALAIIDAGKF